jgi:ferrochelatase
VKGVIILNLGTPAEPTARGLRDFYRYFFSDPFVFDIPPLSRWLLRNLIIMPFRAPKTAKDYKTIWLENGSPLKVYTEQLRESLQESIDPTKSRILVEIGMGYSEPFIANTMAYFEQRGVKDILIFPLFPQYSTATTGSVLHAVGEAATAWKEPPRLITIDDIYNEPAFIRAWTTLISKHMSRDKPEAAVEHVIFSYHGLPEKNITKADANDYCRFGDCCNSVSEVNKRCYRAQCMQTTRSIVESLEWPDDFYSIAFQSRFGRDPWIKPYLEQHIEELAAKGIKRIAVVTPSFVSDCLETLHEIGIEYRDLFLEKGGEELVLIPNLNNEEAWFTAASQIVVKHLHH